MDVPPDNSFDVGLSDDDDEICVFNIDEVGFDDDDVKESDDVEEFLIVVLLIVCLESGFDDILGDGGERLFVFVVFVEVNDVKSARIDEAEETIGLF